jgi:hypothetical protein
LVKFDYDVEPAFGGESFFDLAIHRREFHKQKESASLSCFKVPTAGD